MTMIGPYKVMFLHFSLYIFVLLIFFLPASTSVGSALSFFFLKKGILNIGINLENECFHS